MAKTGLLVLAGIILVANVCLAAVAGPASAATAAAGTCTKSYSLVFTLAGSGATTDSVQIVYGVSPHPAGTPGELRGNVLSADGRTLQEFGIWDPRLQMGEDIVVDEHGNVTKVSGIVKREGTAVLAVQFPYSDEAKTFELRDSKGERIVSADLSRAENKADWNCTADYGIPARATPTKKAGPAGLVTLSLSVIAVTGVAVLVRMRRD